MLIRGIAALATSLLLVIGTSACGGGAADPSPPPAPPPPPPPPPPPAGLGTLEVATATINLPPAAPATYTLTLNGSQVLTVPADGTTLTSNLAPGSHSAVLSGVPAACGGLLAPPAVSIAGGATTQLRFVVTCPGTRPNGDRILHSRFVGNWELFTIALDGSNPVLLGPSPAVDIEPRWSPDGTRIAFNTNRSDFGDGIHIFVMDADGAFPRRISTTTNEKSGLSWSPDGTRVMHANRGVAGNFDLWVAQADGTGAQQITNTGENEEHPSWAPSGDRIAFTMGSGLATDIVVLSYPGLQSEAMVTRPGADRYPTFSPDGRKILFEGDVDGNRDIFLVHRDGSGLINLTASHSPRGDNREPSWSPDGAKILFVSTRNGVDALNFDMYRMDADGRNVVRLTTQTSRIRFPDWRR